MRIDRSKLYDFVSCLQKFIAKLLDYLVTYLPDGDRFIQSLSFVIAFGAQILCLKNVFIWFQ